MLELLSQGWYVICGILLLGILVAVHEFGHFMAARLTGIEVMEFSIGMGPKIVGWTGKRGTKFSLRWIPFGGFCAFYGEDDVEGKAKDDPRAYNKQAAWKRMITVAMGPVMNFVLALAAALIFCWASGVLLVNPLIGSVEEGSPAYAGGLRVGDYVLAINGADVSGYADDVMGSNAMDRLSVFQNAIANAAPGEELVLTVQRTTGEGETAVTEVLDVMASTFWDEDLGRSRIGITYGMGAISWDRTRLGLIDGLKHSWSMCIDAGTAVFDALGKLFTDRAVLEGVSGPVGVIDQTSQMVQMGGAATFINLIVLISVNLGLMNLLPIPGLDGARFIFHTIEWVRGKPINEKIEATIHLVGTLLLLALLVLMTIRDVWRLF